MKVQRSNTFKSKKDATRPIKLVLDINTLNLMCRYVLSSSSYIKMSSLVAVRRLIEKLDKSTYKNDPEKSKRIQFILEVLEARLEYHLTDISMIMIHASGKVTFDVDFIDLDHIELNRHELEWVEQLIGETLQYEFIYEKVDTIQDICTRFNASDYQHRGTIVEEFEGLIDELKNDFRQSKLDNNLADTSFSLKDEEFVSAVSDTYNAETNPNRRIVSGMIGLNEMIGGGFESGRVYMLLGLAGIGKSLTLLNLMVQFKKYNSHYKCKDPTKRPCIVLLTMENTVVETISRLFSMSDLTGGSMKDYTLEETLRIMREDGGLTLSEDSPIDIVIKYKPNKSVDTSYLYMLCDDLEDEGYEVICLMQDHVKRIRSVYNATELRIELGDIVNEMKVFAADKDIPVITVSHLNREASKIMEDGESRGDQADLTRRLGKSNTGESLLMIDNLDCGIIVNLEFDSHGDRYMCYNLIKMRGKPKRTYIAQPFVYGSTIKLVEDFGGVPAFRDTLKDPRQPNFISARPSLADQAMVNNMHDIIKDTSDRDDDDNVFEDDPAMIDLNKLDVEEEDNRDNLPSQIPSLDQAAFLLGRTPQIPMPNKKVCPLIFYDDSGKEIDRALFEK